MSQQIEELLAAIDKVLDEDVVDEDQVDPEPIEGVASKHPWRATCGEHY